MNRKQESVYVTYIYPLQFVVHENERIDFSIEDINNLGAITNLSTFHLLNGITEFRHRNWPSALTFLWVVVEEITDYLWLQNIIDNVTGENSKKRKEMLKDTRTYTISVKQEILLQIGILDEKIYNNIFEIRQARNKLVHEGKLISESKATLLFETVKELLALVSKTNIDFR